MIININIGLLGHVDSGKTTLARALSTIASTAAFDKNPQSQERGITLDLGFSAVIVEAPTSLKEIAPKVEQVQFTFVDCPGHASLIRTIIGGAQIIDLMLLVIDAQKGIQTQTAECIVIGELLQRKLIIVVNKIDLLEESTRAAQLQKLNTKLRKTLEQTTFDHKSSIFNISLEGINIEALLENIRSHIELPKRNKEAPFVMYTDHCFSIKGQGTICTGTIIQGCVVVNDLIEVPAIKEQRKIKSIQMFHRPVLEAAMGDRVGICVSQFNAKKMERGILTQIGYLNNIYAACIRVNRIRFYKFAIRSKSKLHITIGHDTVMANITLFKSANSGQAIDAFDLNNEYEFVEELEPLTNISNEELIYALLEFQTPILAAANSTLIAAKLDLDAQTSCCRLAFWGRMLWTTHANNYSSVVLPMFKVFKRKLKQGYIQRLVNNNEVIVENLFSKQGNRDVYVGKEVELSTGERGVIESTFGQKSKVKVNFSNGLKAETLNELKGGRFSSVQVFLKFKKYIFNKQMSLVQ